MQGRASERQTQRQRDSLKSSSSNVCDLDVVRIQFFLVIPLVRRTGHTHPVLPHTSISCSPIQLWTGTLQSTSETRVVAIQLLPYTVPLPWGIIYSPPDHHPAEAQQMDITTSSLRHLIALDASSSVLASAMVSTPPLMVNESEPKLSANSGTNQWQHRIERIDLCQTLTQ